jgi:hypothetical protein
LETLLLLALAAVLAGCGLKTPPRPISQIAPVPEGLRVRQFGDEVLISWRLVLQAQAEPFGGLRETIVSIEELPPGCLPCAPVNRRELALRPGAKGLVEEGEHAHFALRPERPESSWRVRIAHRFAEGLSRPSDAQAIPGLSPIPRPVLRWDWLAPPESEREPGPAQARSGRERPAPAEEAPKAGGAEPPRPGPRAGEAGTKQKEAVQEARLSWDARQERLVRVMAPGTPPTEQALFYQANVYRRVPGDPWPFTPVNGEPVGATFWSEKLSPGLFERGGAIEYALRFVDRLGGEGSLSEPARISQLPAGGR